TFNNSRAFGTTGTVSSASGPILLTSTTGDITLGANVTATGNAISLVSSGAISQTAGIIDSGSLLINSVGSVLLPGANTVDILAAAVTGAGSSVLFNDTANPLTIGVVSSVLGIRTNNGNVTLSTTTSGDITITQAINLGGSSTVTLNSAGAITENA